MLGVLTRALGGIEIVVLNSGENVVSDAQGVLLFAGLFFLASLVIFVSTARKPIGRARQYLGVKAFTPSSDGDGPVAVRGTVRATDGTATAPVSGNEAVLYQEEEQVLTRRWKYSLDKRREMERKGIFDEEEREKRITTWQTTSTDRSDARFELETSHGPVRVDPNGARLNLPVRSKEQSSFVRRFLQRFPIVANIAKRTKLVSSPRRRLERRVEPGDTVTVIGTISTPDSDDGAVASVRGGRPFEVTTKSRRSLAIRSVLGAFKASVPAMIPFLIGVGAIAIGFASGVF